MFKISLLYKSGAQKGDRISISQSPFLVGRSDSCDQTLPSRSVSRRHCVIVAGDSEVLVQDLDSRNGTIVDGDPIDPSLPRRLKHHSRIKIGKYQFRISIRDSVTNDPHDPDLVQESQSITKDCVFEPNSQTNDLLRELDQLAAQMKTNDASPVEPSDSTKSPAPEPASESDSDSPQVLAEQRNLQQVEQSDSKAEDRPTSSQTSDLKQQPIRLPEHLLPKRAENSQSAAADALKNLFTR